MAVDLGEKSALESIPMTPLIDVVFLLLIFFLVATTLSEEERQMSVKLPSASEAQPLVSRPRELVVNIDASGRYFIGGERVELVRLEGVLQSVAVNNPGRGSVIFRADKRCQWEFVVAAMNACNKAKITDYRVTTLPGEATGGSGAAAGKPGP